MISGLTGAETNVKADTVVAEAGVRPADECFESWIAGASNGGIMDLDAVAQGEPQPDIDADGYALFRIGDAAGSRNVQAAMFDALRLCCRI